MFMWLYHSPTGFDYLPFPSITVCNMSPFLDSKRNETTQDMQDFLASIKPAESVHNHHQPGYQVHTTISILSEMYRNDLRLFILCPQFTLWKWEYCRTANFHLLEIFVNFAKIGRFAKISCTLIITIMQYGSLPFSQFLRNENRTTRSPLSNPPKLTCLSIWIFMCLQRFDWLTRHYIVDDTLGKQITLAFTSSWHALQAIRHMYICIAYTLRKNMWSSKKNQCYSLNTYRVASSPGSIPIM